jgi:hypothetical protein
VFLYIQKVINHLTFGSLCDIGYDRLGRAVTLSLYGVCACQYWPKDNVGSKGDRNILDNLLVGSLGVECRP